MRRLTSLDSRYDSFVFFKHLSVQKGNTGTVVRGFLILARDTSDANTYKVLWHHYDSGWVTTVLSFSPSITFSASTQMDAVEQGKYVYVAVRGSLARVLYHNGTSWVTQTMGPGDFASPAWSSTGPSAVASGGVMDAGDYLVTFRYRNDDRNVFSGFAEPREVTTTADGSKVVLGYAGTGGLTGAFDTVEIYRTCSHELMGNSLYGSLLWKVGEETLGASGAWSYSVGATGSDGLTDETLAALDNPVSLILEAAGAPPRTHVISTYQGTTFLAGEGLTGAGYTRNTIQWSPLHTFNPESFPPTNKLRLPTNSNEILRFITAGDYLYALSGSGIYRFQKVGSQLSFQPVHSIKGLTAAGAVTPVNADLVAMTGTGLVVVHAVNGTLAVVGAVDQLLGFDWAGTLDSVVITNDEALGAVLVLNRDLEQAVLLWQNTNHVTELWDMAYAHATEGIHPSSGGVQRAWFLTDSGVILHPDAEGQATVRCMNGSTGSGHNGTVPAANVGSFTQVSGGLSGDNDHGYLYFLSGENAGLKRAISGVAGGVVTTAAFPNAFALGDRYSVSPVPFETRFWPLGRANDGGYPRSLFRRWIVKGVSVNVTNLTGHSGNPNASMEVGVYRNFEDDLDSDRVVEIDLDENPAECYLALSADGINLEPGVRQLASDLDFQLNAVQVEVSYTTSRDAN